MINCVASGLYPREPLWNPSSSPSHPYCPRPLALPQIPSYLRRSLLSILLSEHLVHLSMFVYQICVCRGREMEVLNELIIGADCSSE